MAPRVIGAYIPAERLPDRLVATVQDVPVKTLAYIVLALTIAVSSCAAIVSVASDEVTSAFEETSS
jgi:Na+/alanine symporter